MEQKALNMLVDVFEQELLIYSNILDLSKNKRNVIIKGKVNELESIVKLEQSLVMQMGKLEAQREELFQCLSTGTDAGASGLTVSELITRIPSPYREKASDYQKKMSELLKELKDANDLNSKLIKNSLDFINFAINLYTNTGAGGNNYANTGSIKEPGKRNLFDIKL